MDETLGEILRWRLDVRGRIQGVGFRPFVFRLASELGLGGFVANNSNGAVIEIEGPTATLESFVERLRGRLPPLARISELGRREVPARGESRFRIDRSVRQAGRRPEVTPDAATCRDCLRELSDPSDRRYRYPFINCTNCGPRYSIIRTVPYDRPATTMSVFEFCAPCRCEYEDPADRRFHAQPNACPVCGPSLRLQSSASSTPEHAGPVRGAARMLSAGRILAIKGIGGYHLACRADREDVVARLRERKLRDGKPLAMMVPDVETARRICRLTRADLDALTSPAAPIVLARKRRESGIAASVAPGCRDFGVMLPYAPVHHLLFAEGLGPLVMTSANLSGQPLTYEDEGALNTLGDVADAFLTHNRPIFRPIDDSVVFTFREAATPIRRARGYAPRPIRLDPRLGPPQNGGAAVLAVGGELKSTVCLCADGEAILSEHLGDLSNPDAYRHFVRAIGRMKDLFEFVPRVVAHDMHPQYLSTQYARALDLPAVAVQHHHAHVVSLMAEWGEPGPVIGLACDGVGYGTDGAVWGCEVLRCGPGDFERLGHLQYFKQVGGDAAAIETWRPAAALLREALGEGWRDVLGGLTAKRSNSPAPPPRELEQFERQAVAGINAPLSSSLGRVFDAVSFLLGLCGRNRHEAEAAMSLEAAAGAASVRPYPYEVAVVDGRINLSLVPAIGRIVRAMRAREPVERIASRFHESVARMLADAAATACEMSGLTCVGLSGGCFANRRLLTRTVRLLEGRHLRVLFHRRVPCGDGGIALGQAVCAAWGMARKN